MSNQFDIIVHFYVMEEYQQTEICNIYLYLMFMFNIQFFAILCYTAFPENKDVILSNLLQ